MAPTRRQNPNPIISINSLHKRFTGMYYQASGDMIRLKEGRGTKEGIFLKFFTPIHSPFRKLLLGL